MLTKKMEMSLRRFILAGFVLLVSGCAVGPDFHRPDLPAAKTYSPAPLSDQTTKADAPLGESQRFGGTEDIRKDWWAMFRSPQLNSLIERAFRSSPTIEQAQAILRQAQENVIAQQGYLFPTIGVNYSPSRNKISGNMGGNSPGVQGNGRVISTYSNPPPPTGANTNGAPYNGPVIYNFHVAQLNIGYVPDIFGMNRRRNEFAQAQAEAMRLQLEATYITLASNVVAAAFQEAMLRDQLSAIRNVVSINREELEILRKQNELGYVTEIDVANQQVLLAQAEQVLPQLEGQLEKTRDLIRALVGQAPDTDVPETFELSDIHLPQELPLSLPSQIIEQRPDVRAAEAQLHAASAQYGVAIANRLPQFSVSAAVGGMASTPDWMFRAGGPFFNLTASVAQTIFDGGTLRAQSRMAEQSMLQAGAEYRGVVVSALQNVADTLHAIYTDADVLKAAADSERANAQILALTQKQYDYGYASYQGLLLAKQNHQLTRISLAQAQAGRLADTAALYQALGGGWWHKDAVGIPAGNTVSSTRVSEPVSTQQKEGR